MVALVVVFVAPAVWTEAWTRFELGPAMGRSFVMTISITVLQVSTAIMAAYAFVFLRFPFKRILFALFMATLLLPLEVTLLANVADHPPAGVDRHDAGAGAAVRRRRVRHLPHPPGLPRRCRARSRTPPGSTATATWRS